jgi:hypothetical protein
VPAFEIDSPEMRGGGKEFDAYACAAITGVAQVDDAAFLFFLSFGVDQDEHFAVIDFVAEVEQATVGADDQGFADFAKFAAFMIAAEGLQAHLVKDTLAAALRTLSYFDHGSMMACP